MKEKYSSNEQNNNISLQTVDDLSIIDKNRRYRSLKIVMKANAQSVQDVEMIYQNPKNTLESNENSGNKLPEIKN